MTTQRHRRAPARCIAGYGSAHQHNEDDYEKLRPESREASTQTRARRPFALSPRPHRDGLWRTDSVPLPSRATTADRSRRAGRGARRAPAWPPSAEFRPARQQCSSARISGFLIESGVDSEGAGSRTKDRRYRSRMLCWLRLGRDRGVRATLLSGVALLLAASPAAAALSGANAAAPLNTALPIVTGVARRGEQLTASNGIWRPAVGSFRYQWLRSRNRGRTWTRIKGARRSRYSARQGRRGRPDHC